ncbi:MAG: thioredoxin family protein [Candidatus Cloacimonetes bacterium]|nr:thioredoxin family protein [Candidatus Cloacimonadota bacterium]
MKQLYTFGSQKTTCKNCRKAEALIEEIIQGREQDFDYRKLHLDSKEAEELGVLCTPTILLDGNIIALGEIPSKESLKHVLLS